MPIPEGVRRGNIYDIMKKIISCLVCIALFSSCHQSREDIVKNLIKAENSYKIEKVSQYLDDNFIYYGFDGTTLNKEGYFSWQETCRPQQEGKISILDIQSFDSIVKTEEQFCSIVELSLGVTPQYIQNVTYRFTDDKVISITVDSTNYEEYIKSYNENWMPFQFYLQDHYGMITESEFMADMKKYLSEYNSLPASVKTLYESYAHLQGTYESKNCILYKKLIFTGKSTVTIIDGFFGFPFSTTYDLDGNIVRISTDRGYLLFEIKDNQTLIGQGFANGEFIKIN